MDVEPLAESEVPISVNIAIDTSGNMDGFMVDVRQSLFDFTQALPERAIWNMTLFDSETYPYAFWNGVFGPTCIGKACRLFKNDATAAKHIASNNGGTELMKPLTVAYTGSLQTPESSSSALIITDGAGVHGKGKVNGTR